MRSFVLRLLALILYILNSSPGAMAQSVDDARRVAMSYSQYVIAGNVDAIVDRTNHVLIEDLGGREKAKVWFLDQYRRLRDLDELPIAEDINGIRAYHDAQIDLFFVETTRSFDGFPNPVRTSYLYLIDTRDKGKTWEVLDLICANRRWLHAIAPSFNDYASVGDLLPN
jgi:hypothetical protein